MVTTIFLEKKIKLKNTQICGQTTNFFKVPFLNPMPFVMDN